MSDQTLCSAPVEPSERPVRRVTTIWWQTALIVAGFIGYMAVRGFANDSKSEAFDHAEQLLHFERAIGLDFETDMQAFALARPAVIDFFNWIYAWTYWPYIIGAFVITWFWRRDVFRLYRNAMLASGTIGLAIFALFPVAPPRFLDGFVDTVSASQRSNFIAHPSFLINEFAALPSFHVGWVTLASVVLALATSHVWLRWALAIPPVLMAISVVVTGNHYVVDIAAGIVISLTGLLIARRWWNDEPATHSEEVPSAST